VNHISNASKIAAGLLSLRADDHLVVLTLVISSPIILRWYIIIVRKVFLNLIRDTAIAMTPTKRLFRFENKAI
jgi:hypothetical protein